MPCRFAAGERYTAIALVIERFVLDQLRYERGHSIGGCLFAGERLHRLTFGIAAPTAAQVASLKKHVRADARAVVNGEFLQIENQCFFHEQYLASH